MRTVPVLATLLVAAALLGCSSVDSHGVPARSAPPACQGGDEPDGGVGGTGALDEPTACGEEGRRS